jgi:hypothetical protein
MNKFSFHILPIIHAYNAGISWLLSYLPTPVIYPDFGRTSQLWMYLLTPVKYHDSDQWACRMPYHLSFERHRMAGLDDCIILQPKHLVRSRLVGMHDSINVQNLRSHSFACRSSQTMSRATKEHLAWHDLRQTWVTRGTQYPTTMVDQGLRMSNQVSQGSMQCDHGTKNWSHLGKVQRATNRARSWSRSSKTSNALWTQRMTSTVLSTRLGTTRWKI